MIETFFAFLSGVIVAFRRSKFTFSWSLHLIPTVFKCVFLIFNKFGNTQSLPFFYKQNVPLWIQVHLPSRARLAHSKDIVTTLVENIPIESLAVPVGGMESTKMMDAKRGGKQ